MTEDVACSRPIHHLAPQFRLRRIHGNVERRQFLLIEPQPVVLLQVGQGDEIAKEKRIAVIVVLDVERGAHAVRQALDKAENAFISALANKRCWLLAEKHAQILIIVFGNRYFTLLLLTLKANRQYLSGDVKAIINQVANEVSIDRAN